MIYDGQIAKGDIFYVDLGETVGSETKKVRPCVICSNNKANYYAPLVTVVPITSKRTYSGQPTQVILNPALIHSQSRDIHGLILTEQIRTVSKQRLGEKVGRLTDEGINLVEIGILVSMGIKVAV